ncbi:DEAD/DEAH box helicase [Halococcus sp. AFM35]|uniref:DEAD/DEAH box helicase n=1 Tax=Halococcus sp. AFM35 TaxID=3421653 RepID=UPI003EBED991
MNVAEAVPEFADAFAFESFNRMQREALPAILDSDENVVASAPTASGKTALAELAICKCLQAGGTALFIAPLRALTNEKESEWERFEEMGYSVYVVTGERDLNPHRAERADILVMTPEKVDSATRKHDSPRYGFITDVGCCVIDEVHLLDSENRGSVLEVTISRLRRLASPRIVALSATMPNVEEVADWLDAPSETTFDFGQEYRPVDLESGVRTYTHGENAFADKYRRLYRALDLAEEHIREDGQALVFVASRQDTVRAAEKARDELASRDVPIGARGDYDFHTETQALENQTLRNSALDGVAFHHAGLSKSDKDHVEQWFREGKIQLLFSTSTLAWGVNLPARCVVIRDTKYHDPLEGEVDMSPLDVLQMLGRAGRPGYDDAGYAYVVCDGADAEKYRKLLRDGTEIDSHLTADLDTHLNAEIAMGTIDDVPDVMAWLETTFAFVRARSSADEGAVEALRGRVREALSTLEDRGFVAVEEGHVSATPLGTLTSAYYLRLPTAHRFHDLAGSDPTTNAILETVARSAEFDSVNARRAERDAIESVLDGHGGLDPGRRKVLAILASSTRAATPSELRSDAWVIRQNAVRLLAALRAFLDRFGSVWEANRACRVAARVENGVGEASVALTAIDGVGPGRASKLADEGIATPAAVVEAGVEDLVAVGLTEGVAERVAESARDLPALSIDWGEFPERIERGANELCEVTVENGGDGARAGIRVSVNDTEMTATSSFLGTETVPAPVFGGDPDTLRFTVEVVFPDLPLAPVAETRTVWVD